MAAQAGRPGEGTPEQHRHTQRFWLVILAVLTGAVGMVILSAVMVPERQQDIWVELAKSSAQVVVLVLATGVVAAMLRDRDALREEQRRHQAQLLAFLDQVEAVYSQVRTARRMLRTYGFDSSEPILLSAEQATGFRTQMALLNEAQLAFEVQSRKVAALPGLWGAQRSTLADELTAMSDYLRGVIREWETDPTVLAAGGDATAITGWPTFRRFVGYDDASVTGFRAGIVDRMLAIERLISASDQPAPVRTILPLRGDPSGAMTASDESDESRT